MTTNRAAIDGALTFEEVTLIHAYHSGGRADRSEIVRRYAKMMKLSAGRAEDALDLWVHLLGATATGR